MTKFVPTYELYGENAGSKPDFWLHCETIPSRSRLHHWEIKLHRHESFFQILYISAGSGDAIFGAERHQIIPNTVITVPPRLNHAYRFSRDIDGLVVTVLASHLKALPGGRSPLGEWLARPHLTVLNMDDPDAAHAGQTLLRLGAEFASRSSGRTDLLEAYVTIALQLTMRLSGSAAGETGNENGRRMEQLNGLIQQHLRAHKPAAFYAAELGISPTHLNRIARGVTGLSVHEMIAQRLADEAKRELVFTFGSAQEISYRLGFADPAYFSRFFLKQTGQTPRAWRIAERAKLGV
ncbi:helix-turn-helix domain-containing protein [Rhizobium bangladeshense]|uniref:helix-turn-helix domain-containing protein n=1 Tax=Rhizobium bangladeshense TaxID=1138189 RepID=UPI001C83770E|nr:helix-turn-helix domain-containing protein [Rhizobium bangladeshense]MBX4871016.1 helix-turn-helix domain-containing protein [Rhizobium bangladeshense]MBX4871316.1 helix-turn-helix domain-containing protein [Rhizobium bangladeshense]MBX4887580.1 helix-turn-helix domain-containing protein [Rhizobium bangladeshense]